MIDLYQIQQQRDQQERALYSAYTAYKPNPRHIKKLEKNHERINKTIENYLNEAKHRKSTS